VLKLFVTETHNDRITVVYDKVLKSEIWIFVCDVHMPVILPMWLMC
jgi:hypothetical protein